MSDGLALLTQMLPPSSKAGIGDDWDYRSRATLSYVVELATTFGPGDFEVVPTDPAMCPNCGLPVRSERSPYCSDECREESAFVRQFRNGLREGLMEPERQAALGQKLWRILGGGLPRRIALIPEKQAAKFLDKAGVCAICGAPATRIDNVGSG